MYVAGRYRDGALTDTWTDVARCARGTFVAYVPACSCGWTGELHPPTLEGFSASQRALRRDHVIQPGSMAANGISCGRNQP
jgi:hypothetical protein